jgi:hypothetical protein
MRKQNAMVLALGGLALPLLPGCFFFDWLDDDYDYGGGGDIAAYNDGSLLVEAGAQQGDMGEISGYAADATASNATYYGSSSSVRLDSIGDDWWVMSYVNISNLDIVNAPAGTYRFSSETYDGSQPSVSVTGCSGPSYGNYTFDTTTSDGEITITDNADGTRTLEFAANFQDYYGGGATQLAEGSIVYRQGTPPDYVDGPTYVDPGYTDPGVTTQALVATDATQSGAMGEIAAYDAPATATEGYYYGNSASIRLDSVGEGWWVMSYISVNNLDLANAPAGTYEYTSETSDYTAPQVSVTGCSGPSYGNYTFDSGSEASTITITDNEDGSRTLDIVAQYQSYDGTSTQVATSSFRYSVDAPAEL